MHRLSEVKNFFASLYNGAYQNHSLTHSINLAFFCYITAFSNVYSFPRNIAAQYGEIYIYLYIPTLILSIILITHPLWLARLQNARFISAIWYVSIFYNLIFVSAIYTILADFSPIQLMILMAGVLLTILVLSWQGAIAMICSGAILAYQFCVVYLRNLPTAEGSIVVLNVYLKMTFFLILITAILIAFLKPKQEAAELAEEKVDHLSHVVEDQNQEIMNLSTLKRTFLMNLQHETNTPITGVYSMSQVLGDCYDKLTDEERKRAIATITSSSERLISYANNLIDVSKLMSSHYNLKVRSVNLSSLLEEVLRKCKKLYIPKEAEEDREITVSIEPNLKADCDEYFIKRSFENLIINAIQYCKKGSIVISLTQNKDKDEIEFTVKDSGIGVPQEELNIIFDPFVTSSKTTTPAGGRGMGLTLVKAVAEAHKGTISVTSEGKGGSVFTLFLPKMVL